MSRALARARQHHRRTDLLHGAQRREAIGWVWKKSLPDTSLSEYVLAAVACHLAKVFMPQMTTCIYVSGISLLPLVPRLVFRVDQYLIREGVGVSRCDRRDMISLPICCLDDRHRCCL